MKKVCMVVQDRMVRGGIAAVISGYCGSKLEQDYDIIYVESYKDGSKLAKLLKGIQGYLHFAKVLLVDKPALVHIHSSFGPSFYRKIPFIYMASMKNIPIINHIHGADFDSFYVNANELKKKLIHMVYNKCTAFIALSAEWKERLSKIIPPNKIAIIENYSILYTDAIEERLDRVCNNNILFLGEIGRRKGCFDIPLIVEKVVKVVPNVKFVLAGTGTQEDESVIKKMLIKKGISNNVEFPGWITGKQKDKYIRDADVFLLPSYNEGMPMSVLDAMGYGLPIVSTNVGGIPKIVQNGVNGICCNPGDIDQFAGCIIEILLDSKLRARYSKGSMSIVNQGYSLKAHLDRLMALYEGVLE